MLIVWDEPKRLSNLEKHGVDFADIGLEFFDAANIAEAKKGRYYAAGWLEGRPLIVFFALLGREGISLVSARKPYRKERKLLE